MKIEINILPDEEKKNRKTERKIGSILRFSFSLVFVLLVLTIVFLIIQIVLKGDYNAAKQASQNKFSQSVREVEETEKFLSDMENISKKIKSVSGEMPYWSRVLRKLSEICPQDVRINLIHVEKEHLKVGGFAKTRDAFLVFQEKLRSEGFKNFVSPPSNIVSPENFDFLIEADVDKSYLNQAE